MLRTVIQGIAALLLFALSGCGPNYSPNTYSSVAVQQANKVEQGVVVGVRHVAVSADATIGTVTGAAAGGIGGSQLGTGGAASALGALGGSVIGGLVGTSVEHATGDTNAYEYIVRQTNGDLVSVTQRDTVPLEIGQTVLVITGKQARVVPDYTVTVPGEPAPAAARAKPGPKTAPQAAASRPAPSTPAETGSAAGTAAATAATTAASVAAASAPVPTMAVSPPPSGSPAAIQPGAPVSLALPPTPGSPPPPTPPSTTNGAATTPNAAQP